MSEPDRLSSAFRDRVCVVTGAASGIGLALSTALARLGARVVLTDRDGEVHGRAAELASAGHSASSVLLDVTDRDSFARVVAEVIERQRRLDFLFNNAGVGVGGEARDLGAEEWDRVIAVNLGGVIHGVQAAYPAMLRQRSGHIVNVASVAGLVPFPGEISYTASKWAVVGLTLTLRTEAAALGVRVTLVCPGKVETPIYRTSRILGFDRDAVLALWPEGVTPAECAAEILEGVARDRAVIVVTRTARALWWLQRASPGAALWLGERYLARLRRHRPRPPGGG